MRYAVGYSADYNFGSVCIRDYQSTPAGRVLCFITRDNRAEANVIAQHMVDLLNADEEKVDKPAV